jgi:hypothetical protein
MFVVTPASILQAGTRFLDSIARLSKNKLIPVDINSATIRNILTGPVRATSVAVGTLFSDWPHTGNTDLTAGYKSNELNLSLNSVCVRV